MENINLRIVYVESDLDLSSFVESNLNFGSFYKSLNNNIKFFIDENHKEVELYKIFNLNFIVYNDSISTEYLNKYLTEKTNRYKALMCFDNPQDEEISILLRKSKTLEINEENTFKNKNNKIIFSENGFLISKDNKQLASKFLNKVKMLMLLTLAYNYKINSFLEDVNESLINNDHKQMIKIRKEILEFDLKYYFINPVKDNVHETSSIWKKMANYYNIHLKHEEIKNQILELTAIINEEEKEIKNELDKKRELKFTFLAIFIAFISAISPAIDLFKYFIK